LTPWPTGLCQGRGFIYLGEGGTLCACYGSTPTKIGSIQRRLAWPLRKDDTQIREAFHILRFFCHSSLFYFLLKTVLRGFLPFFSVLLSFENRSSRFFAILLCPTFL